MSTTVLQNNPKKRLFEGFFSRENTHRWLLFWGIWTILGLYKAVQWIQFTNVPFNYECRWQLFVLAFGEMFIWAMLYPFVSYLTLNFLKSKKWYVHLAKQIPMSALFSLIHVFLYFWAANLLKEFTDFDYYKTDCPGFVESFFQYSFFFYCQMVGVIYLLQYRQLYRERNMKASQLEKQLSEAKLHSLKMQLHPHFLFNSLHSVHALMDEDTDASKRMIVRLSNFLRATLEDTGDREIPLEKEIEFLENYLKIEQTRFNDRLDVSFDIDPKTVQSHVPSFIFQPLVENAVKHGIAPYSKAGEIRISSKLEEDSVSVLVEDNGPGINDSSEKAAKRWGIGLRNVRERLKLYYGSKQSFELFNRPEGGFAARITVPFSTTPASSPA